MVDRSPWDTDDIALIGGPVQQARTDGSADGYPDSKCPISSGVSRAERPWARVGNGSRGAGPKRRGGAPRGGPDPMMNLSLEQVKKFGSEIHSLKNKHEKAIEK